MSANALAAGSAARSTSGKGTRTAVSQLRQARQQLQSDGTLNDGLLDARLQASWLRSHRHGLPCHGKVPGGPHASGAQLAHALEQRRSFVAQARPVMEFLCEQIAGTGNLVVLADAQGMLLHALGDTGFADKAARVALRPGAIWLEQWRGTNAIGTALVAGQAVVVHGAEHYLERNAFLTCAAAPIADPGGRLIGVLDISGDRAGYHPHTLGLVRSAARLVEHQLFQARHGAALQLRLHSRPEGLGTVTEGLLALSDDGWIVGANSTALDLLGLDAGAIGAPVGRALAADLPALLGGAGRAPRQIERCQGGLIWARLDRPPTRLGLVAEVAASPVVVPVALPFALPVPPPSDALAALDTGDAALKAVIARARRVVDKPIPLLLQGESGVGKELFARACHDSGPRRRGPFVAVNCAALPETLIEAELFGYRPGAFTGAGREGAPGRLRQANSGTLFLDEIGDMPLELQARLLRVLQERQVQPLGGSTLVTVDFQLICATHRRLPAEVDAGRFREDLYYRVNGLALQLPALRERSDLPALVAAILHELAPGRALRLAPELEAAFARHRWPGNLRQLSHALRTACALMDEGDSLIDWPHLPDDLAEALRAQSASSALHPSPSAGEDDTDLRHQARRCIRQALEEAQGNVSLAARRLGISRNTLYRKLREAEAR